MFESFYIVLLVCSVNVAGATDSHNLFTEKSNIYFSNYLTAKNLYSNYSCSGWKCYANIIADDLKPFASGIDRDMINMAGDRGVDYIVQNKRIYREKNCLFPSRCEGVDYFLNVIRDSLPDSHFVVNFHDWPVMNKRFHGSVPVFSFSKTEDYLDIFYPSWSFWKGGPAISIYPTGIGRWDKFYKSMIMESEIWPWDEKIGSGFFIGSRTSAERDNLILLSRKEPKLVIAQYTKNQAWKSEKDTLNQSPAKEVSFEEHCHYRYLFNFRGVAASFRYKFLFLCKSLVIHVGDEWKEFFYDALKPWYHYVPIQQNATQEEYRDILEFLIEEDTVAQDIAERGFEFIQENLRMIDVENYWKELLKEYSKLLTFTPTLDRDLIEVTAA